MKSRKSSGLLDLDRDLPTSRDDVIALRSARGSDIADLKTYLEFLARFPAPSTEELRAKKGPRGPQPFELKPFAGGR
jgi:hypothetical protein